MWALIKIWGQLKHSPAPLWGFPSCLGLAVHILAYLFNDKLLKNRLPSSLYPSGLHQELTLAKCRRNDQMHD